MAMKDLLGRFQRQDSEEFELDDILNDIPEEYSEPEPEKPSFVFTDINSEPIKPTATKISSSDDDRFQMFEIDLSGKKAKPTSTHSDTIPIPKIPNMEDTIVVAPTPSASATDDDYEVDFGYSAPGALDDITFTTNPASVSKPTEPEPVVYNRTATPDLDDEEYYDSYEPMFEESYGPGSYFASGEPTPAKAEPVFEEVAEPVKVYNEPEEPKTYTDDKPRYENYRKDYNKASDGAPRTYENNIDDSVFLPDEGDAPLNSRRSRRRLTVAIIAIIVAILLVLGAFLISHFGGRSNDDAEVVATTQKTTAFERSVSNNSDATTTTTEAEEIIIGEDDELSDTTTETTESTSTSRRTSTTTSSTTTTSRTTTSRTTTSRTTTTTSRTTTTTTAAPTTAEPTTTTTTRTTTAAPSPWDQVGR